MTLQELKARADAVDVKSGANVDWTQYNDYLAALKDCNLKAHKAELEKYRRHLVAANLGFPQITVEQAITAMVGEPIVFMDVWEDDEYRQEYEYSVTSARMTPERFIVRKASDRRWFPERLHYTLGTLAHLNDLIPYGVLLRVKELRDSEMFDCFHVVAPTAYFAREMVARPDPVVLGTIYLDDKYLHYFVAQW